MIRPRAALAALLLLLPACKSDAAKDADDGDKADTDKADAGKADAGKADAAFNGLSFEIQGPRLKTPLTWKIPYEMAKPNVYKSVTYVGGKLMSNPLPAENDESIVLAGFTLEIDEAEPGTYETGAFDLSFSIRVPGEGDNTINLGEDPTGKIVIEEVSEQPRVVIATVDVEAGDSGHDSEGQRYTIKGKLASRQPAD